MDDWFEREKKGEKRGRDKDEYLQLGEEEEEEEEKKGLGLLCFSRSFDLLLCSLFCFQLVDGSCYICHRMDSHGLG